ncbi:hypothetical protein MXD61_04795 [Frankia sp. AgPm24]|uniref:hypothetical protein n=1 Tax=Frankia sp. AgPm24 TaxID=631128 RepID=UPI00200C4166|nr:hypothetical protein [Frankia sp. AgPm24]MCK9921226.1 hypothetical protein [Frankia sp. AgPm24]
MSRHLTDVRAGALYDALIWAQDRATAAGVEGFRPQLLADRLSVDRDEVTRWLYALAAIGFVDRVRRAGPAVYRVRFRHPPTRQAAA